MLQDCDQWQSLIFAGLNLLFSIKIGESVKESIVNVTSEINLCMTYTYAICSATNKESKSNLQH